MCFNLKRMNVLHQFGTLILLGCLFALQYLYSLMTLPLEDKHGMNFHAYMKREALRNNNDIHLSITSSHRSVSKNEIAENSVQRNIFGLQSNFKGR